MTIAGDGPRRTRGALAWLVLVISVALLVPDALVMTTALAQLGLNVITLPGRGSGFDALGQAIGEVAIALLAPFVVSVTWLVALVFLLWRGRRRARWLLALTLIGIAAVAIEYSVIDHRQYDLRQPVDGPVRPDYHSVHVPNSVLAAADIALAVVLVTPAAGRGFRRRPVATSRVD